MVERNLLVLFWIFTTVFSGKAVKGDWNNKSELTLSEPACHHDCQSSLGWCYCNSADSIYYGVSRRTSYSNAVENCRMMGGDLASIHNPTENSFLRSYASHTLIGLLYDDKAAEFSWSDKSVYNYTAVDPNFKNFAPYLGYCAQIGDSYWENVECDSGEWYFTCKMLPTLYPNYQCPDPNAVHLDSGTVFSPGYPLDFYPTEADCKYMLAAKNSQKIQITFESYWLGWDSPTNNAGSISVYEGFTTDALLGSLDHTSSGAVTFQTRNMNRMMLVFHTVNWRGYWKASFKSIA